MMEHKGYCGHAIFDDQAGIFHGEVLGIRDVVTFQGESVAELRQSFVESVEDYIDFCRERGEQPAVSHSGKLLLKMSPELHRRIAAAAELAGQTPEGWAADQLHRITGQCPDQLAVAKG